jgi:hypothetical protein
MKNETVDITPKVGDFCEVNYEGRMCLAVITNVIGNKTFDVNTSFNAGIYNIPFEKFRHRPGLGTLIVNMIEENYGLGLLTVDAAKMSEEIDAFVKEKSWMITYYPKQK